MATARISSRWTTRGQLAVDGSNGRCATIARFVHPVLGCAIATTLWSCGSATVGLHSKIESRCGARIARVFAIPELAGLEATDVTVIGADTYEVQDESGRRYTRANCNVSLFGTERKRGLGLRELARRLQLADWVDEHNTDVIEAITGLMPISWVHGNSSVVMRLRGPFPPVGAALYVRLSGLVDEASLLSQVQGTEPTTLQVLEAVLSITVGTK